jgi:hypothetical protein
MQVGVQRKLNFSEDTPKFHTALPDVEQSSIWNMTLFLRHRDCLFSEVRTHYLLRDILKCFSN